MSFEFWFALGWSLATAATLSAVCFGVWWTFLRGRAKEDVHGWNARTKDSPFSPVEVGFVLNEFALAWEEFFGEEEAEKIADMLNQTHIFNIFRFEIVFVHVVGERFYTIDWNGTKMKVGGHLASPRKIKLAVLPGDRIGYVPIFHELTHAGMRHIHGDGDKNHSEPGGEWKHKHDLMIQALKAKFRQPVPDGEIIQPNVPEDAVVTSPIVCGTCQRLES